MKKKKRNPNCPACHGSGSYDTMETIEPCPFCNPQAAQQSMHLTAFGARRAWLFFGFVLLLAMVLVIIGGR